MDIEYQSSKIGRRGVPGWYWVFGAVVVILLLGAVFILAVPLQTKFDIMFPKK
jgi:hypothetical protein